MKKTWNLGASFAALLLLISMLLSLSSCSVSSLFSMFMDGLSDAVQQINAPEIQPVDGETEAFLAQYGQSYGYEYLGTLEKGAARQSLYRKLDAAVMYYHTDAEADFPSDGVLYSMDYAVLGLTTEEATAVWKTYRDDHPLYYWIASCVSHSEKEIHLIGDSAYQSGSVRAEINEQIYEAIDRYVDAIPQNADDYRRALILHDALADAIDYVYDELGEPQTELWAHSIEGVFLEKGAVCEGFAKAYQLLLTCVGVENLYVTGRSMDEDHAWNVVRLDGEWYSVDITWDDGSEDCPYLYFCLSEDEFSKTHEKDLPTNEGLSFQYEIPTLCEYGIEWVEVYRDSQKKGVYKNTAEAFAAIKEMLPLDVLRPSYTVKLLSGEKGVRHTPAVFHLYGDLPNAQTLILEGEHIERGDTFTATRVELMSDCTLKGRLVLKSLILDAQEGIVLTVGNRELLYGPTREYFSVITDAITVE